MDELKDEIEKTSLQTAINLAVIEQQRQLYMDIWDSNRNIERKALVILAVSALLIISLVLSRAFVVADTLEMWFAWVSTAFFLLTVIETAECAQVDGRILPGNTEWAVVVECLHGYDDNLWARKILSNLIDATDAAVAVNGRKADALKWVTFGLVGQSFMTVLALLALAR